MLLQHVPYIYININYARTNLLCYKKRYLAIRITVVTIRNSFQGRRAAVLGIAGKNIKSIRNEMSRGRKKLARTLFVGMASRGF